MDLVAQKRVILGKKTRTLRYQGRVSAELYGRGLPNLHLSVARKDLYQALKAGENAIINLVVDSEKKPTLIYDVSRDPVTDEILSADFYQVRMDELLTTKVPVDFRGESPATKAGGVLVKAVQEVEVEALPANIPQSLTVDLSKLAEIGQSFQVRDWPLNDLLKKGVKILLEPELVVVTVKAQMTEEQEQAMAATTPTLETVKVETEEKKAERALRQAQGGEQKKTEQETQPAAQ